MKLLQYIDTKFNPLNNTKKKFYEDFKKVVNDKAKYKKFLLLYRGTMYSTIEERLANSNLTKEKIFNRAFYFGEKARFCSDNSINYNKKRVFNDINDCSPTTLKKIFLEIQNMLSEERLKKTINSQLTIEFKEYFTDPTNKEIFTSTINNVDSDTRLLLRDYYLYLLHTGYTLRYDTPLISTSIKRSEAKKFKNEKNADTDRKIIFHYFVSQPFECSIIAPWKISGIIDLVTKSNLPIYTPNGLFPSQKEIAVKGGLFPQFILGIELVDEKKFIVNPNLYQYEASQYEDLIKYGIQFEQSDFIEEIKETKLSDSIHMDAAGCISSVKHKV